MLAKSSADRAKGASGRDPTPGGEGAGRELCARRSALLDGVQKRDAEPRAAVPVAGAEGAQCAPSDVRGVLPGHGPEVGDEQLPARGAAPAWPRPPRGSAPSGDGMLWIASALVTTSKVLVGERQRGHVGRLYFHPVGDPGRGGVGERGFRPVAALVPGPQVRARRRVPSAAAWPPRSAPRRDRSPGPGAARRLAGRPGPAPTPRRAACRAAWCAGTRPALASSTVPAAASAIRRPASAAARQQAAPAAPSTAGNAGASTPYRGREGLAQEFARLLDHEDVPFAGTARSR